NPSFTLFVIIRHPCCESNRIHNFQSGIGSQLLKSSQGFSLVHIRSQVADPYFDGVVACSGSDFNVLLNAQPLAADRAGIKTELEFLILTARRGGAGGIGKRPCQTEASRGSNGLEDISSFHGNGFSGVAKYRKRFCSRKAI